MYEPQHMHPAAVLELIIKNIYKLVQALLPLIIIVIGSVKDNPILLFSIIGVVLILFIAYQVLYWIRFIFYITSDELRIEYGVFVRQKRYIPKERIQTVQISAGVIQRIFGLVKVQVETAGGGSKAEVELAAISNAQAVKLQEELQTSQLQHVQPEDESIHEYRLSTGALLVTASTSNGIGVVLSVLLVIFSQVSEYLAKFNIYERLGQYAIGLLGNSIYLLAAAVIVLLLLAWILSVLGTIIALGGFNLIRTKDRIIITRGLLEHKQLTIPLKRIQAVNIIEGVLRQPFGFVSLQVITAGYSSSGLEANNLFPLMRRDKVVDFLNQVLPEFAADISINKLPARSRGRYILMKFIPAVIIAGILYIFVPYGYFAFILVPLAALWGNSQYLSAGWNMNNNNIIMRYRLLGRVTSIIPRRRIQSLDISRTYFQKRKLLNTLRIAVASGTGGTSVKVIGMDDDNSNVITEWFNEPWIRKFS